MHKFRGPVQRVPPLHGAGAVQSSPEVSKEDHWLSGGLDLLVMLLHGGLQGCPAPEQMWCMLGSSDEKKFKG